MKNKTEETSITEEKKGGSTHLGFFLMSSNCPTTWDTLVRTILKAMSSSPMISNLSNRRHVDYKKKQRWRNETVVKKLTCIYSGL